MASQQATAQQPRTIPIDQLNIQDLSGISRQIEQEVSFFAESLQELKEVEAKFGGSKDAVAKLKDEQSNAESMVPLSESMYVKGTLSNVEKVLVDIGTGYFVEMEVDKAVDYFTRKQTYLQKQIGEIEKIVMDKQRSKSVISEALQSKVQAALASQKGEASKS